MSVIPEALDGAVIPGGCDTCHAEQHVRAVPADGISREKVRNSVPSVPQRP